MRTLTSASLDIKDKVLRKVFIRSWRELVRVGVHEGVNFRTANEIAFDILVRKDLLKTDWKKLRII